MVRKLAVSTSWARFPEPRTGDAWGASRLQRILRSDKLGLWMVRGGCHG